MGNVFVLQYLHNALADVTTVVVVFQYLHITNRCCYCSCYTAVCAQYFNICSYCVCCIAVLTQYFNKCCYYGCCTLVLHITFMDVATVVAGTAAVTAVHGTHVIKL